MILHVTKPDGKTIRKAFKKHCKSIGVKPDFDSSKWKYFREAYKLGWKKGNRGEA